jgi:signal transduction histidine kinase
MGTLAALQLYGAETVILDRDDFFINIHKNVESHLDASASFHPNSPQNAQFEWRLADLGTVEHPVWFRFKVHNRTLRELPVHFWVVDYNLDQIELYRRQADGTFAQSGRLGAAQDFAHRYIATKDYVFPVTIAALATEEFYVRVVSKGLISVPMALIAPLTYQKRVNVEYTMFGLFYGAILVMLFYNALLFIGLRDRSLVSYIGYLISLALFSLNTNGLGFQYIWPQSLAWQAYGIVFTACCMGAFICDFSRRFLNLAVFDQGLNRLLVVLSLLLMAVGLFSMPLRRSNVLEAVMVIDFAAIIICLYATYRAIQAKYTPAINFGLGWLAFFSGAISLMIGSLGYIETSLYSLYGMFIGAFVQMGFLAFAISERFKSIQKELSNIIQLRNEELSEINQRLEGMVADRTRTIKRILDSVKSGFFMIDREGRVQPGFTASCEEIVSSKFSEGVCLWQALTASAHVAEQMQLAMQQVFNDTLPEVVALAQIPARIETGEKMLSLEGSVIRNVDGEIDGILFTVNDITRLREIERQKEVDETLIMILRRKREFTVFLDYFSEEMHRCSGLLKRPGHEGDVRSTLHTIKGNAAMFSLLPLAKIIHRIEDQKEIAGGDLDRIENFMAGFLKDNEEVLGIIYGAEVQETVEIALAHLSQLRDELMACRSIETMRTSVNMWIERQQRRPAKDLVRPIIDGSRRLALRLGKKVEFQIENGDVQLDPGLAKPLLINLAPLFRNAIDHGIEPPHERGHKGEAGTIKISFHEEAGFWVVRLRDDGRGVDADLLAQKALSSGLISQQRRDLMSYAEKCLLLFESNLTTASTATDVSGRGVGMAAVKDSILKAGGTISIESVPGRGTTLTIRIPYDNPGLSGQLKSSAGF